VSRRLRLARRPGTWRAAAHDAAGRARPPARSPAPPTWPPPGPDVRVEWPAAYEHPNAARFAAPLRRGFAALATLATEPIPQPFAGVVLIRVRAPGAAVRTAAIDYFDFPHVNAACLDQVDVYFKMQHLPAGYGDPRVLPGGYVAARASTYDHADRLRRLTDRPPRFDVYGRFGREFAPAVRTAAVARLTDQDRFTFAGGLGLVSHAEAIREAARAGVCVDLPGQGPLCHRLIDYLAIGACVVAHPHAALLPVPLTDGVDIAYTAPDLSDLVELCDRYAHDPSARRRLQLGARTYFDAHLDLRQLAGYYLHHCLADPRPASASS
jgi:hypothetical protein